MPDPYDSRDPAAQPDLRRVIVVGSSCVGKSTLAARLTQVLDVPRIELDEIHWGPGWTTDPPDVFREKVEAAVAEPRWVCAGNYAIVRDLVWSRATALVWIDLPFARTFARALRRTAVRTLTREQVCGDNRERWLGFFDRDWIPYWVIRTWRSTRVGIGALIEAGDYAPLDIVVLRSPADVERFVEAQSRSAALSAALSAATSTSSARTDSAST